MEDTKQWKKERIEWEEGMNDKMTSALSYIEMASIEKEGNGLEVQC